ncbi:hypothetical protein GCG54_00004268 [Colletotrichum gloeosporioides]|uniref:Zn(2)-C6 fungal-type domain-containing protein n=1 Tax=Colletotrichum gloeosporioides TaxID=474922 RepID=A0A8H4CMJ7_COLGL|nr:uncharacterized protein GCG54_00004268 [Colletotrichum gloeosporioides]KAF3806636.1 hypothetical protein GCG54_00004268 [Colletotrichum gloeosporioides]
MRRSTSVSSSTARSSGRRRGSDSSSKTPETPAAAAAVAVGPSTSSRASLASRACDACRARRRKCHFEEDAQSPGAQCRDCIRLGISCSFLVPTRPRGPKRRKRLASMSDKSDIGPANETETPAQSQAERPVSRSLNHEPVLVLPAEDGPRLPRVSQARSPYDTSHAVLSGPSPRTGVAAAAHTESPSISGQGFPTDEVCSRALINIMMADYLDLVYPLVPVVHRPTFRHDLASNRDLTDRDFFALLMSLVALTVGLLPSRFRVYRAVDPEVGIRFETRTAFINCCAEMATRLRDATYFDQINSRKWAVSMFDIEFMQLGRLLGLHRISDYDGLNCIETQLRKKAFWLLFYAWAHTKVQSGRSEHLTYFHPNDLREVNFEALMPLAVDDEQIFETRIVPSVPPMISPGTPGAQDPPRPPQLTLTSAFNLHSRVFLKGLREAMTTVGCECELRRGAAVRLARLRDLLAELRYMLDDAPGPMRQWASADSYEAPVTPCGGDSQPAVSSYDSPAAEMQSRVVDHSRIAQGQADIMRANLHVTHLWLQSILLEQIDVVLQESAIGPNAAMAGEDVAAALKANWAEREDICRQLLHLLHSIPYVYLEPNGLYLTYKVRDVAVTLLNCPFEAHERPARRAAEYMRDFTRALSRLDRSEFVNTNSLKSWVDVDREMAVQ